MTSMVLTMAHLKRGAILLIITLAGLLILHIFQVNALTAQVYLLGDQQQYLESLKEQKVSLEANLQPSFSRPRMEQLAQQLHFERVTNVSYLKVLNTTVAQNSSE